MIIISLLFLLQNIEDIVSYELEPLMLILTSRRRTTFRMEKLSKNLLIFIARMEGET